MGRSRESREEGNGGKKKRKQGRSAEYLGPRESSFGVNFHGAKLLTRVAGGIYSTQAVLSHRPRVVQRSEQALNMY